MKKQKNNLEVEVKFYLDHPDSMRQRLMALDAAALPKVFEINLRLEDRDQSFKARDQLLRLRKDDSTRLTFKSKPDRGETQFKIYRELEVTVSDFDTMREILHQLGYRTAQVYEKWRQTFHWNKVELCLDTMPYGSFLEIEGPREHILTAADKLNLVWEKRILKNYLAMFEALRVRENLPFSDVTFSNFENHSVDIVPLMKTFEAGQ